MSQNSAEILARVAGTALTLSAGALVLSGCSGGKPGGNGSNTGLNKLTTQCTVELSGKIDFEVKPILTPDEPVAYAEGVKVDVKLPNGDTYLAENPLFTRLPDQNTWCVGFRTWGQDASSMDGNYATAFPLGDKHSGLKFHFTGKGLPATGAADFDPSGLPIVVAMVPIVGTGTNQINIPSQGDYQHFLPDDAARKRLAHSDIAPIQPLPANLKLGNLIKPVSNQ